MCKDNSFLAAAQLLIEISSILSYYSITKLRFNVSNGILMHANKEIIRHKTNTTLFIFRNRQALPPLMLDAKNKLTAPTSFGTRIKIQ